MAQSLKTFLIIGLIFLQGYFAFATQCSLTDKSPIELNLLLINSAESGDINCVQKMLDHSKANETSEISVNFPSFINCETPLIKATNSGNFDMVKLLAENGANVNQATCQDYITPLHIAAFKNYDQIIRFLISKGAMVDPQDKDLRTPLFYASIANAQKSIDALNEANTNIYWLPSLQMGADAHSFSLITENKKAESALEKAFQENINFSCKKLKWLQEVFITHHYQSRSKIKFNQFKTIQDQFTFVEGLKKKAFDGLTENAFSGKDEEAIYQNFQKQLDNGNCSVIKETLLKVIDFDIQHFQSKKTKSSQCLADRIKKEKQKLTESQAIEAYFNAFAHALDPHTQFLAPEEGKVVAQKLSGQDQNFVGIGVMVGKINCDIIVSQAFEGRPAWQAGIRAGDIILAIDQNNSGSYTDLSQSEVKNFVDLALGEENTKLRIRVKRTEEGSKNAKNLDFLITRKPITLEAEKVTLDLKSVEKDGTSKLIGVLKTPAFRISESSSTLKNLSKKIRQAEEASVDALILDLQDNAGGALQSAISVTGSFLQGGSIVGEVLKSELNKLHFDESGMSYKGPLVILTNRLSASASEIVAGTLKDYGRALIVGDEATFGKGSVQSLFRWNTTGEMFKITTDIYITPEGKSPQVIGIAPDIVLPSLIDPEKVGESTEENHLPPFAAQSFKSSDKEVGFHSGYHKVFPQMKEQVQKMAGQRNLIYQQMQEARKAQDKKALKELRLKEALNIAFDLATLPPNPADPFWQENPRH